jgi:glycosyltransferase involved in cell wall biosynthesis
VCKSKGKKLIADINEDYLKLLKDRSWAKGIIGTFAKIVAFMANSFAAKADLLIVADTQVPPFNAKNRLVIKNLPDSTMIPDSGELSETPRAIYIGDIRKTRGLYSMLKIAELSPRWTFDLVGPIAAEDSHYVEQWIKNSPASSRVKFHGALAPNKSWEFAKGAWVGLAMLELTPAFIEAVPSKLYEYSYAGLAVISSPLPRCIELINESGGGVISQSDEGAASVLNSWADNHDALLNIRRKSKIWGRETLNPDAHYLTFRDAVEKL